MDERVKRVFGATVGREGDRRRLLRLLGLSADDCLTPLTIIGAAHVRLRRVRRLSGRYGVRPRRAGDRIRQISDARDALLRQNALLRQGFSSAGASGRTNLG